MVGFQRHNRYRLTQNGQNENCCLGMIMLDGIEMDVIRETASHVRPESYVPSRLAGIRRASSQPTVLQYYCLRKKAHCHA